MTHSFDKDYWDKIWQGDRATAMAAGDPNPHLVQEVNDLTPGTAIDAGCGAGTEAIWLAARGWRVTGADIAADALACARERATAYGVDGHVQFVEADLSTWTPHEQYDLVTTHYSHPSIPQLEFYDRLATWVAPGGTLFIVGHLHPANHGAADGEGHLDGHGHRNTEQPPAEASATAAAITARLDPAVWDIQSANESHRTMSAPDGRETTIHDVVVRATRRN
ncbi:class I SAM-dependent methyltransferase [Rhodococcoides yunnanense]|uniref:Class I SAM-dependent methyltransferase n=1 Tax=Rhodococcoides yunnanense TaxID=278209 RepID=A0ABU4BKI3_9NOCA|nr:class I SAM-dependent methyltransferase [Rhodococcus yunnanensis]MDV6264581.1 class I SAM-dependent methyltransferase [Rhodococcus yunnanensis]